MSGDCELRLRFPSPVLKIQFHPRDPKLLLVCPLRHSALLVNVDGSHRQIPVDDDLDLNIVASFDRRGNYIYTGNSKGKVGAYSIPDLVLRASFRIGQGLTSTTAVKSVEFARRGDCFLLNSADRIIRVYKCEDVLKAGKEGDPEPVQKLQDLVNKTMWKKCCFSGDGEYICAGSARQHALYIWEKTVGNLVKILHGTKGELLLDVVWHPMRPIVASISSGVVSIWAQNQVENWSAFAPDFKELDENVEYEERESEFDLEDEDKIVEEKGSKVDDDLEVDVTTCDPITAYVSSDEGGCDESMLAAQAAAQAAAGGPHSDHHKENRRKKPRTHDVKLDNATDDTHPLLNKPGHGGGSTGSKKSSSHSSSHHHHHHHRSDKEKRREKNK
ncbi:Retinoblastoma-binding protein 5 [Orchesella cincta]|uniref:Retinoblastoma-binding protein 5 n=1 Tax=Orchesella cincta TaxID=48709 RepID=A0A1D2NJ08_ORCCI|nr:Retinoblastoma-binding protein 5 [Orchesella cincta]